MNYAKLHQLIDDLAGRGELTLHRHPNGVWAAALKRDGETIMGAADSVQDALQHIQGVVEGRV